ncbi:MAG: protein translocase subunit SecD [Gaiellaceae bacterium]
MAALVGVALLAIPSSPAHKKVTLGLDLQGGLEVVLKAVPPKGKTCDAACMDRSISIMRSRIDKLGVSEPEIRKQGSNQIVIQLAGVHDVNKAAQIIGTTAQLQFYDFENDLTGPSNNGGQPVASGSLFKLLKAVEKDTKKGTPTAYYLFNKKKQVIAGPEDTVKKLLDTPKLDGKQPKGSTILAVPHKTTVVSCDATTGCLGQQQADAAARTLYYLFKYDPENPTNPVPEAKGDDLKLSSIRADISTQGQGNVVQLGFTGEGAKKFHDITRLEAQRGAQAASAAGQTGNDPATVQQFAQHFAIVLDNELRSTPYIDYKQNPDGIDPSVNGAEISNINSFTEAKDLALVLQTGALPVEFQQIERTDVSATLGKDSLKEAKTAALIGLLVVALFLLILYRFLGVVAVIGLGIYAAFLYAAILIFGVTLTLPGFAGLVLTIGVAADANVVIFERIKEEVRAGKSVRAAISAGYAKGFHTIIDANVVTAITAVVLFLVATAGVKGFALMLLIGTVMSLLTAVAATRAILTMLAGFEWFDNPKLMGAQGEPPKWIRRDFIGLRNRWFAISGVFLVLSAGAIAVKGLNLGIDFEGGTQITFSTPQAVPLDQVRAQAAEIGQGGAYIQGKGTSVGADRYKTFQIRTESLEQREQGRLTTDLQDTFNAEKIGVKNVSASFGRQIAKGALLAVFASLLLIVLYISLRFEPKFAGPVIIALLHDVLITVGIYALLGREVTTATVAAVLTVLGYSIYDTIIIFDRIRENTPLMKRASFRVMANVSLWETIPRSLATTFITLLPISALYLFGGETLKDFAFALLIGIGAGAYSSIFIAAPLLAMLKEREPEYARRRDDVDMTDVASVGGLLEEAEALAAAEPTPDLVPDVIQDVLDGDGDGAVPAPATGRTTDARERRRQRRKSRPHGRAR